MACGCILTIYVIICVYGYNNYKGDFSMHRRSVNKFVSDMLLAVRGKKPEFDFNLTDNQILQNT